jgi:exodeoxyribonuclease-3
MLPSSTMKIATWNVNSIKARKERLLDWLARHAPDVLCLQELKLEAKAFPEDEIRQAGYHAVLLGQKTYNGVAILSREPASDVRLGFGNPELDVQSRVISARVGELQVISAYVPNGAEITNEKYAYKLSWLESFAAYLRETCVADRPIALCGDFNIAPDDRDVPNAREWADTVYCTPEVRAAYQKLLDAAGFRDCLRMHRAEAGLYTWWDYRQLAFPKNQGVRIDHVLATAPLAARCSGVVIDRDQRKGKLPSDHAPVIAEFG